MLSEVEEQPLRSVDNISIERDKLIIFFTKSAPKINFSIPMPHPQELHVFCPYVLNILLSGTDNRLYQEIYILCMSLSLHMAGLI